MEEIKNFIQKKNIEGFHDRPLGLFFFQVYINELHPSLHQSEVNVYSVDTSISFSSDSILDINKFSDSDLISLKKLCWNQIGYPSYWVEKKIKISKIPNHKIYKLSLIRNLFLKIKGTKILGI